MSRPPDEYTGHYGPQDQEKLRKKTAREVVQTLGNRHGELRHARFKKVEATKTLHVTLWWSPEKSEQVEESAARITAALQAWVWDQWTIEVRAAATPAPDVVWDAYAEKFVPRKAYRPLGTPGKVKRTG